MPEAIWFVAGFGYLAALIFFMAMLGYRQEAKSLEKCSDEWRKSWTEEKAKTAKLKQSITRAMEDCP